MVPNKLEITANVSPEFQALGKALEALVAAKSQERSEAARRYQIAITDLEKVIAYVATYIDPVKIIK